MSSVLEQALRDLLQRAREDEASRRATFDLPVFEGGFSVDPNDNKAVREAMEEV